MDSIRLSLTIRCILFISSLYSYLFLSDRVESSTSFASHVMLFRSWFARLHLDLCWCTVCDTISIAPCKLSSILIKFPNHPSEAFPTLSESPVDLETKKRVAKNTSATFKSTDYNYLFRRCTCYSNLESRVFFFTLFGRRPQRNSTDCQ